MRRAAPVVVAVALLIGCGGSRSRSPELAATSADLPDGVLTVGSVSLEPAREHAVYEPVAAWLAAHLHDVGIGHSRVVVVDSLGAMAERISAGEVDLYFDSPFPVAWIERQTGAQPFLRRWKKGVANYSSVVFTRADSGINDVDGLRGKVIAFGEPFSTSSFLMPKATLMAQGFRLERYEDPAAEVPPDRIGYLFSEDAENTMAWVLRGRIVAGAVNTDYFEEMAGERRDELRVLLETEEVPRHMVCHRADLAPATVRTLEAVLLEMHRDPDGRAVLEAFEGTTRFDRFPIDPGRALAPIRELLPYVETDIGQ